MNEQPTVRPDIKGYEGLRVVSEDPTTIGGIVRLLTSYHGAEMLGIVGVCGIVYLTISPVANQIVQIVGIVAILMVVVAGMIATGRPHASAKTGPGET